MEDDIDTQLELLSDPKLPSEYLSKRVNSIMQGIDLQRDQSLKKSYLTLEMDADFMDRNFVSKAKQYDHLPMAYNAQVLVNQIKHDQQRQHLDFYSKLTKSYTLIEEKANELIGKADVIKVDHENLHQCLNSIDKDASSIMQDHQRYQGSMIDLVTKKEVLSTLYNELTLTDQEKRVLLSSEEDEFISAKIKRERQLLSIEAITDQEEEFEQQRFDRFKQDFFRALQKLNRMQDIAAMLNADVQQSSKSTQTSKLALSITESVKYVEEAAYAKLVKHLKNKIRVFDTPLENQPEFLIFMKVTLKMLKEKSIEMYGHIINELIKSRQKYIELSYTEKMNFIYHSEKQKKQAQTDRVSNAKNVAQTIAWLHETLINELQILDHTDLDKTRFLDALNNIFSRNLAKMLKQKLDQEISSQEDFSHSFELYYMLFSFYQIMKEHFGPKLKISQKEDLSDLLVLQFFGDLKSKSLTQMADCAEPFLAKLHNLFFSQASESALQVERFIKVTERIFSKVIDVIKDDKKDLEFFKKRVLSYAIIRILPSIRSQNFAEDSNILSLNLVHLYNYYDTLKHILISNGKEHFQDAILEITKRLDFLSITLKQSAVHSFQSKPSYQSILTSDTLLELSQSLDDLLEDLDLEDTSSLSMKSTSASPLSCLSMHLIDQQQRQLLTELIKEELLSKLRTSLQYVVDCELQVIDSASSEVVSEEERNRKSRIVEHIECEMTERIERIKKRIAQ